MNNNKKLCSVKVYEPFVQLAKDKNLSPAQLANQLLIQSQQINIKEQELALARIELLQNQINNVILNNKELEKKLDVLTDLLSQLFVRLGE